MQSCFLELRSLVAVFVPLPLSLSGKYIKNYFPLNFFPLFSVTVPVVVAAHTVAMDT